MTRLIDANALTDELIKGIEADTDKSIQTTFTKSVCMILCKAIEQQPTVDAVQAIRCKDCKYRITANCERFGIKRYTQSDSFCSWAEPKVTE